MISKTSKIRRIEDLNGAVIGVSQYGSEADTFARVAQAGLKPDKDTTIIQLGGHPQVAASLAAGKLEIGVLGGLATLTVERAGARLLTSAQELKVLSPSGTFATTRAYIQKQKRGGSAHALFCRSAALHQNQSKRNDTLLQKYLGGLNAEEAGYLYQEQVSTLEALPSPNEKAIQAVLDRESDPKIRSTSVADVIEPPSLRILRRADSSNSYTKVKISAKNKYLIVFIGLGEEVHASCPERLSKTDRHLTRHRKEISFEKI